MNDEKYYHILSKFNEIVWFCNHCNKTGTAIFMQLPDCLLGGFHPNKSGRYVYDEDKAYQYKNNNYLLKTLQRRFRWKKQRVYLLNVLPPDIVDNVMRPKFIRPKIIKYKVTDEIRDIFNSDSESSEDEDSDDDYTF